MQIVRKRTMLHTKTAYAVSCLKTRESQVQYLTQWTPQQCNNVKAYKGGLPAKKRIWDSMLRAIFNKFRNICNSHTNIRRQIYYMNEIPLYKE